MSEQRLEWNEWVAELSKLVGDAYGPKGPIEECGEDCWRESYDEGLSPRDAFESDKEYWDPE